MLAMGGLSAGAAKAVISFPPADDEAQQLLHGQATASE
jgi:hypothetical protein